MLSVLPELSRLHDDVQRAALAWLWGLPRQIKSLIETRAGNFPAVVSAAEAIASPSGPAWLWYTVAVLPVDTHIQRDILAMTSLRQRLVTVQTLLQSAGGGGGS